MKATILHDEHGHIIAAATIVDLKKSGSKFTQVGMIPGPGQRVLELDLEGEFESGRWQKVHQDYRVDVATAKLVKKADFYKS
jgi:hypothetical protein